jgi:tRNA(fMet)-specific endonuclease VapC
VDLVKGDPGAARLGKIVDTEESFGAISVITVHEYLLGVHLAYAGSKEIEDQLEKARRAMTAFQIIPLTTEIVEESSKVQAQMQTRGLTPGINDLYIASTALTLKLALVTRNDQDFKRIPGLKVETY